MTARHAALVTAVAAIALAPACGADGGSDPADAAPGPRAVVEAHLDARVAGDCAAYAALETDEYRDGCYGAPLSIADGEPVVGDAEVDGDRATVPVTTWFGCTGPGAGDPVTSEDAYLLVLVDGEWLVDGYEVEGVTDDDCIAQNGG